MTAAKLVLIATAIAAATIGLAGIAHADDEIDFQSPSGDVICAMAQSQDTSEHGKGWVLCQVLNHTYPQPPLPDCPVGGRDYELHEGAPASVGCQGGLIVGSLPPAIDYGQTRSIGTITCDVEPSGVTCTDRSTGHFLRLSRDSYQVS